MNLSIAKMQREIYIPAITGEVKCSTTVLSTSYNIQMKIMVLWIKEMP